MLRVYDGTFDMKLENNVTIRLIGGKEDNMQVRLLVLDPQNNDITNEFIDADESGIVTVDVATYMSLLPAIDNWRESLPSFVGKNTLPTPDRFLGHQVQLRSIGRGKDDVKTKVWGLVARLNQLNDKNKFSHPMKPVKVSFQLGETVYVILFVTDKSATYYNLASGGVKVMIENLFAKRHGELRIETSSITDEELKELRTSGALPDGNLTKFKSIKDSIVTQFMGGDSSGIDGK